MVSIEPSYKTTTPNQETDMRAIICDSCNCTIFDTSDTLYVLTLKTGNIEKLTMDLCSRCYGELFDSLTAKILTSRRDNRE
jgi:hypothetical protein